MPGGPIETEGESGRILFCQPLAEHFRNDSRIGDVDAVRKIRQDIFDRITISVSGVGSFYPEVRSLLATTQYLKEGELQTLIQNQAYCDILLRFINYSGRECDTDLKDRTYLISLDAYRRIPTKIVVASGTEKVTSIQALLNGQLVDVLIIDQFLAKGLLNQFVA